MQLFTLFLDHPEDARPEYGGLHTESIPGSVHKVALAAFAGKVIVLLDELEECQDKLICLTPTFSPRSLLSALYPLSPLPSTLYPLNFSSLSHHCSRISNTRTAFPARQAAWLFFGCLGGADEWQDRALCLGYVKSVFMIHVGGTRCVTSSTDNIMKIHFCITLNVEFIRGYIFKFLFYV
jgi:hypothetical protein